MHKTFSFHWRTKKRLKLKKKEDFYYKMKKKTEKKTGKMVKNKKQKHARSP